MKPIRFLFLSNNFPPVVDGVGDYTFFFSRLLLERGYQVAVLCHERVLANVQAALINIVSNDGSYIHPGKINVFPIVKSWETSWRKSTQNVIQIFNPDIINIQYVPSGFHQLGTPLFLLLLPFAIGRKKLIVTFHEVAVRNYLNGKWKSLPTSLVQRFVANFLALNSIVSFTAVHHYLKYFYIKKPKLLPIGNNLTLYARPDQKMESHIKKFILTTFGIREYEMIIDTLAMVREKSSIDFEYQIIGKMDSEKMEQLRSKLKTVQLEDSVSITGFMRADVVLDRLTNSDIFLELTFPDKGGRGGTNFKSGSFAAAVAAGLPVIGFKGDMTDDSLQHGENIWLCDASDPETISDAIIRLMNDLELRAKLRNGAIALYNNYLSWSKIGDKYLSDINKCLS